MLFACGATLLFSWSVLFGRRSAALLGTWDAVWLRTLMAALILFPGTLLWGQGFQGAGFTWFFISGFVGFGLSDFALFRALPPLGARLSLLLVQCLAAPLAATIEWMFLGTTLSLWQLAFITLIVSGVVLALTPTGLPPASRQERWMGILWGLVAAFGQALGAVLSRVGFSSAQDAGLALDAFSSTSQRLLGGLIFIVIVFLISRRSLFFEKSRATLRHGAGWALGNALAGPVLGVTCYQAALRDWPSGLVLPIVATAPLVILPWSWWLEGDRPSLRSLLGGVLAVAGVVGLISR